MAHVSRVKFLTSIIMTNDLHNGNNNNDTNDNGDKIIIKGFNQRKPISLKNCKYLYYQDSTFP